MIILVPTQLDQETKIDYILHVTPTLDGYNKVVTNNWHSTLQSSIHCMNIYVNKRRTDKLVKKLNMLKKYIMKITSFHSRCMGNNSLWSK